MTFFRRSFGWIAVFLLVVFGLWACPAALPPSECATCADGETSDTRPSDATATEGISDVPAPDVAHESSLEPPLADAAPDMASETTVERRPEGFQEVAPESISEALLEVFPEARAADFEFFGLAPKDVLAKQEATIRLQGKDFPKGVFARLGQGGRLPTLWLSATLLEVKLPPLPIGFHPIEVWAEDGRRAGPHLLEAVNLPPAIADPGSLTIAEEQDLSIPIQATDPNGDRLALYPTRLPPGARWEAATSTIRFRPTFIQGGRSYTAEITATDGLALIRRSIPITVTDTIKPPFPTISQSDPRSDHQRLVLQQKTDSFLDSPGHAGRTFQALVSIPQAQGSKRFPVRLQLHGFGGSPSPTGTSTEFVIQPHDPHGTYWWGFASSLPASPPAPGSIIPPYTLRRVLHLLEWLLATYSHADPERVYLVGVSMGGTGAKTLGLRYARHFAYIEATIGQTIPRFHRPSRLQQLSGLWGKPTDQTLDDRGGLLWDQLDITRILRDEAEASDQFLFTKHSKDDDVIHFGSAVLPSPLTQISFFRALQDLRIGHYAVWDEGGHGSPDPVLGDFWSDWSWHRIHDPTTFLRRDLAFPAFSKASHDPDPGQGQSNGKRPWSADKGYAGQVSVPQDTGWDGAVAGAINRHLRWDSTRIVDTLERFEIPLRVFQGPGQPPPQPSYPTRGDRYEGPLPVEVDLTPRRLQAFHLLPGTSILWTFGSLGGIAPVSSAGHVTLPKLPLTASWQTLVLQRQP